MRRAAKIRILWFSFTGRVLFALLLLWAAAERAANATGTSLPVGTDMQSVSLTLRHSLNNIAANVGSHADFVNPRFAILGLVVILSCGMFALLVRKTQRPHTPSNEALA